MLVRRNKQIREQPVGPNDIQEYYHHCHAMWSLLYFWTWEPQYIEIKSKLHSHSFLSHKGLPCPFPLCHFLLLVLSIFFTLCALFPLPPVVINIWICDIFEGNTWNHCPLADSLADQLQYHCQKMSFQPKLWFSQDFPEYLWEKWKANRFLVELNEGGDISITIGFAPLLPLFSLKMTHCSHELKDLEETIFGKFKAKCETVSYNGQPGGMSKRILWTKFDPDFLCYFPAAQQKGHNSEMWNRNFKRSNFLWNKFCQRWWTGQYMKHIIDRGQELKGSRFHIYRE